MLLCAAGCGSDLKVNPEAFRGPMLSHTTAGDAYMLVAEMPSPGWAVEIDATRPTAERSDIYVTLRRPNPAAVYTQQIVTQRVLTRVGTERPLGILARVVGFADDSEAAYRRAE